VLTPSPCPAARSPCGGSGVLICAADGRLWACDLARPCFARSPSPMATSLAPAGRRHHVHERRSHRADAGVARARSGRRRRHRRHRRHVCVWCGSIRAQAAAVRQSSAESAPGGPAAITRIAAALMHSAAVSSVGTLFTWGDGGDGRLGLNDPSCHRCTLSTALPPPPSPSDADLSRRRSLLMGSFRSAAVVSGRLAIASKSLDTSPPSAASSRQDW